MSDQPETPASPFVFKPATQKPSKPAAPTRTARKPREPATTEAAPKRKRRARASSDVLVLKACLRQLRTLDPKDALRLIETLRVLFK
jgi:hypothetical protein